MSKDSYQVGVLDPIDRLHEAQRFYPQFAKEQLKAEGNWTIRRIWNYLDRDLGDIARYHGSFMHLIRLM